MAIKVEHVNDVEFTLKLCKRFWEKVNRRGPNECWLWLAYTEANGYGRFSAGNRPHWVHRVSWVMHNGPIPDGKFVCHNCPDGDNPLCVNPGHLWLGTDLANKQDMVRKGRGNGPGHKGEAHGMAKLQEIDIPVIRKLYDNKQATMAALAKQYNVGPTQIQRIVRRLSWKHIEG